MRVGARWREITRAFKEEKRESHRGGEREQPWKLENKAKRERRERAIPTITASGDETEFCRGNANWDTQRRKRELQNSWQGPSGETRGSKDDESGMDSREGGVAPRLPPLSPSPFKTEENLIFQD